MRWVSVALLALAGLMALACGSGAGSATAGTGKPQLSYEGTAGGTTESTQQGGAVHVNGYTRANGAYVAPHTRSAPGRGGGRR